MTLSEWMTRDQKLSFSRGTIAHARRWRHLCALTRGTIESETDVQVLDRALDYVKQKRPPRGLRGGHPTTNFTVWITNHLRALQTDNIPTGDNWLKMKGERE